MAPAKLKTAELQGLTELEAKKRLKKIGPNELACKAEYSNFKLLLDQFASPMIYILVFAGAVTLFLRDLTDAAVIWAAVFLNTALGFFQERKAQKALEALRSFLVQKAPVIRAGLPQTINAREIVPGDLVILNLGSRVPADGVLVEAKDLSINEAILTGESMPVKKKSKVKSQKSKVFMGTTVVTGIGKMRVTKTGRETEMGKIGGEVAGLKEEKTPLQIQLNQLAKILARIVAGLTVVIFAFGELQGYDPLVMFTTSVAVAVAAIPEGLVVTLTVILSLGMQRILRRKSLVRKLLAAETLGSVSVICCDKTGTLTEGKMKVVRAETTDQDLLAKAAFLCNDRRNPMEAVMKDWSIKQLNSKTAKQLEENYPRLDEIPFSPEYKYIATLHKSLKVSEFKGLNVLFVAGAPELILAKSNPPIGGQKSKAWQKKFAEYGRQGYRLVGFACKEASTSEVALDSSEVDKGGFDWLGVLLFEDPVRSGVAVALAECQQAGIKVKVVTGDYLETAKSVLKKIGLWQSDSQALTGEELEKMSSGELKEKIKKVVLFSRVNPHQKVKIVEVLQSQGEVVAMTGDGVNDAPALKKAEIGIVVNEASDVARETADIVLLNSSFQTIVAAVEEGRAIFENIKKVVLYLLSDSFAEVILVGGAMLLGLPLPLTAAQILWVNLIEDSLPSMALAFEPKDKDLMQVRPRPRGTPILSSELKILIFVIGIFTDLVLLVLLWYLDHGGFHLTHIQTIIFAGLAIDSLSYVFACRSLKKSVFQMNPFENKMLNAAVLIGLATLFSAVYLPGLQRFLGTQALDFRELLLVFTIGAFNLSAIEITKWFFIVREKA